VGKNGEKEKDSYDMGKKICGDRGLAYSIIR